jgi:hypothetical protein
MIPKFRHLVILGIVAGLLFSAGFTAGITKATTPQSQTFPAIGSQDYFTVPANVSRLTVDIAAGSDGWNGGLGGRVIVDIAVTPGEVLEVVVGSGGSALSGRGGWPDGGDGGGQVGNSNASGGGGSTSVKNQPNGDFIAIAGGGGGGSNFTQSGAGGFPWGEDARAGYTGYGYMDGRGATQSAGGAGGCEYDTTCNSAANGSFNQGGHATIGGGGGGGYYGGGAGGGGVVGNETWSASGGGGSSWVDPARVFPGTNVTYQPGFFPSNPNDWRNGNGYATFTWTPDATTTTSTTTTTTTSTTAPPSTTSTLASTTTSTLALTPSTTTTLPSWFASPIDEDEKQIVGVTPFPISGFGSVVLTNETGFTVSKSRVFTPRWRTRVYVGTFSFSLKARYIVKKKRLTYSCTFPKFSTESRVTSSNKWRWYQPPRGCTLPKELIQQLSNRSTTMTFAGTFTRRWATTGKTNRPDGSKISVRKINVIVAASESVALN